MGGRLASLAFLPRGGRFPPRCKPTGQGSAPAPPSCLTGFGVCVRCGMFGRSLFSVSVGLLTDGFPLRVAETGGVWRASLRRFYFVPPFNMEARKDSSLRRLLRLAY